MKKVLRLVAYLIGLVVVVVVAFAAFVHFRGIPKYEADKVALTVKADSAMVAHGAKLASVQCLHCHRGSDGKVSGRPLSELPPDFGKVYSANITQSKTNGVGNWTDGEIYSLLRTGVKPDGQFLPNYMPKFPHMSEYDMQSVIAWLRSDRPEVQASEIPKVPTEPSFLTKFLCLVAFKKIPLPAQPVVEPDTTDLVAYGRYL
ncbi:MAG: c-type cytochrome, partial [Bacteroidetes bacterium]|nr:c-type cytochrome [Bacteroidota bacterium]